VRVMGQEIQYATLCSVVSDSLKKVGRKMWFDAPNGPWNGEFIWNNILVKLPSVYLQNCWQICWIFSI